MLSPCKAMIVEYGVSFLSSLSDTASDWCAIFDAREKKVCRAVYAFVSYNIYTKKRSKLLNLSRS